MKKTILITGGYGFVGSQIVKFLEKNKNYKIKLISRKKKHLYKYNKNENISVFLTKNLFLEDYNWWVKILENVDVFIHAAWFVEPNRYMTSNLNIQCLEGSLTIGRAVCNSSVKNFIGLGTCFEYDIKDKPLDVTTPLKPISIYAKSKVATYLGLSMMFSLNKVNFVWCRLFYLYGVGEHKSRLMPMIKHNLSKNLPVIIRNKDKVRDFLNVKQAGELIVNQVENSRNEIVNICSGVPITIENFVYNIADKVGKRSLIKFKKDNSDSFEPDFVVGSINQKNEG